MVEMGLFSWVLGLKGLVRVLKGKVQGSRVWGEAAAVVVVVQLFSHASPVNVNAAPLPLPDLPLLPSD